ncbi:TonB-dependent receptor [Flavobacterium psychrophilum]|uniref:TonB-dependent receptor n=1 Tax=Flavobacterium psychrophilum TaxID=96345 RepID=UPI000B7C3E03|nr:TonB-dependent receptor [Flavobacterium psychrophilum]MCB6231634.1 TonB-dependent receptor [Flavobacterium psychrophilum]SNA88500.1 putative TonB-dependent outer membrane receptor [Flavobacterium psychrophilum]
MKHLLQARSKRAKTNPSLKPKAAKQSLITSVMLIIAYCLLPIGVIAQETDTTKTKKLDEVMVQAIRVNEKAPVSFSNFTKKELGKRNLGQDIPILMNYLPSVVTTSDAGNGFGYTGIRVRGSDATRVNVTVNGIPYNDSESQGTYFVDMPDFASSLQSIQLQRGVGTSTNGSGAFGASLNMLTDNYSEKANGEISNSFGSFNSRKHTVKFSTGLINGHFEIAGRLSDLRSSGYIDRAFSNLKGYFLQGTYVGKSTLIKAMVFGGNEKTYQAYYGIDEATLKINRTENPIGAFTDQAGNHRFYDNETDNYKQDHYQLHWNEKISEHWNTNLAFHFTNGLGYYENYKEDQKLVKYGISDIILGGVTIKKSDLIRQKWLDNDFYGTTFSANFKNQKLDFILGGSANKYEGKHYGKVIWTRFASNTELGDHYYDDFATKTDATVFAKATYKVVNKINLFVDLQYRNVGYKANFVPALVNENLNFLNPKAGITYLLNNNNHIYFSYAKANREPNRTDYENGTPKAESLDDYELGWRFATQKTQININGFYMQYKNQLVLTGALNAVGSPIRTNVGKSYRVGLEIDANIKIANKWAVRPNITISENKNKDFVNDNGTSLDKLGNTNLAYSPKIVAGNILSFVPIKNWEISLLSKFVGEQFLSNLEDKNSKLKDYYIQNFHLSYVIEPKKIVKAIEISFLANNIFDTQYISNGADYGGGYVVYFPQAGANILAGLTLKF